MNTEITAFVLEFSLELRGQSVWLRSNRVSWSVATKFRVQETQVDNCGPRLYLVDGRLFSTPEKVLDYVWLIIGTNLADVAMGAIESELKVNRE